MAGNPESFFSRGLERWASLSEKDFAFIGHDFQYACSTFQACFLSPRVYEAVRTDSTVDSFVIEYGGHDGIAAFQHLDALMHGQRLSPTERIPSGLLAISSLLGNDDLAQFLIGDCDHLDLANVCGHLESKSALGRCTASEIEFAASHFFELDQDALRNLPVSILEDIFSHESLCLETEDSLLQFICTVDCDRRRLLRYVSFEYLSVESVEILLAYFDADSVDSVLWSSLCRRLVLPVAFPASRRVHKAHFPQLRFAFDRQSPFRGILSFLTEKFHGNIHEKEVVTVTSSGDQYHDCWQVATLGWDSHWCSTDQQDSWIAFDFKERRVCLSHYTLKSHPYDDSFFLEWVIEGSNDGETWISLDHRVTHALAAPSQVKSFDCSGGSRNAFRHLRMRLASETTDHNHYLALTNIEFFGELDGSD
jgi:hypothetical protein